MPQCNDNAAGVPAVSRRGPLRVVPDPEPEPAGEDPATVLARTAAMLERDAAALPPSSAWRLTYAAWISALDAAVRLTRSWH